ncbi:MAG: porin family protein [Deltaproteobacteria bacterium]|nr:porin family protein [Deltaproteobacteria bacterium]
MLRFIVFPVIAFALVLSSATAARAEVVVVRPESSSSQVVVKTKPPTVVVVKTAPAQQPAPKPPPPKQRDRKLGLHFDFGGSFGPRVQMGGVGGALRFRPTEHVGIDLGSGYYAGNDYQGFYRREIPLTANVLFFLNPQHKFQFYFVLGPGMSFGRVDTINEVRSMTHVGGQAGAGVELRLAPAFALNADVRGVIRHRIDNDPRPEFFDGGRGTNTSGGAVLTFGGTFYF